MSNQQISPVTWRFSSQKANNAQLSYFCVGICEYYIIQTNHKYIPNKLRCDGNIFEISVHQNRTKTNDDLTPVWHLRTNFNAVWIKSTVFSYKEKAFEHVVCKMVALDKPLYLAIHHIPKKLSKTMYYQDDVIKWKHFPRYRPFVRGIHRSSENSLTTASDAELRCFFWSAPE